MFLQTLRKLGKKAVIGCFLEIARPSIPEALELAAASGARFVLVTPLMLFPGRHAREDIPRIVRETARKHRDIRFSVTKALAFHPKFLAFLREVVT